MKRTHLVVVPLATFAGLMLLATPASASEETIGSCMVETMEELGGPESVEHIIEAGHADGASDEAGEELKSAEEDLEGCLEAPSPIIPELNEIIWGGLAFLILLGLMVKFAVPAVTSAMEGRTQKIRDDLEAAETARTDAVAIKDQHGAELADAKNEASRIIEEARQEAGVVRADLQQRAEADIAGLRSQGEADVAAARERAIADLQTEVSEIVVGAAERVVEANLDPAAQRQLIENYITSVGSR
ncbi:MAG: F-type H+-transporting ATPase subunit b [Acidimicrobiales bacterium]